MNEKNTMQSVEQLRYARLLDWGTRAGLAVLVASFAAYAFGLTPQHVAVQRLPELWALPLAQYLQQTQTPTGWGWLPLAGHGDVAALLGIVVLAGCSLVCLLALAPLYLRRGERAYAALCVAEALVIGLAASGVLGGGH